MMIKFKRGLKRRNTQEKINLEFYKCYSNLKTSEPLIIIYWGAVAWYSKNINLNPNARG